LHSSCKEIADAIRDNRNENNFAAHARLHLYGMNQLIQRADCVKYEMLFQIRLE